MLKSQRKHALIDLAAFAFGASMERLRWRLPHLALGAAMILAGTNAMRAAASDRHGGAS
jgi:hypothetical protein